jgi:hypothetical protein
MRSSPSFLVVNRRGLGIRFSIEQYSSGPVTNPDFRSIERKGSVYQEALAAATRPVKPKSKIGNRKALALASLVLVQALIVVVNEVFDVVGALHFT